LYIHSHALIYAHTADLLGRTLNDDTEFDTMNECCTATKRTLRSVDVTTTCPDGTTKDIVHFASTATECACTQ
ncbi:MAG: hypothetical protein MJE68_08580, partial [Proteobacteria bacterium]|nr:hypothetical protein [Pseudomonadota bacterium]